VNSFRRQLGGAVFSSNFLPFKVAALLGTSLGAGDASDAQLKHRRQGLLKTGQEFFDALIFSGKTVKILGAIDDRVDGMGAEHLLSIGDAYLSSQALCPFVQHPDIVPVHDQQKWLELEKYGILTREELISIANLAGVLVQEEARHCLDYVNATHQNPPDAKAAVAALERMQQSQHHLAEFSYAFTVHVFLTDRSSGKDWGEGLDLHRFRQHYPHAAWAGVMTQYVDDLRDILRDLQEESKAGGRPSTNCFLTEARRLAWEQGTAGTLEAELQAFQQRFSHSRQAVPLSALPEALQHAVQTIIPRFEQACEALSNPARDLILGGWDVSVQEGCLPLKGGVREIS
jgi:hypothetical protein